MKTLKIQGWKVGLVALLVVGILAGIIWLTPIEAMILLAGLMLVLLSVLDIRIRSATRYPEDDSHG